jgi:uncharacterized membrane protein YhaH (DUF805 family)
LTRRPAFGGSEAAMNWTYVLTSFEGRINRQPFWIALLCLLVPELIAHFTIGERWSSIVSLILAYPNFAVFAKRGHDRNVPTWVPGVLIVGSVVFDLLVLLDLVGPLAKPNTLFYVIGVPLGIMALILVIDFGFRRGTVGPNQYGPDPLAPA